MSTYYVAKPDGTKDGPFDEAALRDACLQGRYSADCYVWQEGTDAWQAIGSLKWLPPIPDARPDTFRSPVSALLYQFRHLSFQGRATRQEFWMSTICLIALHALILIGIAVTAAANAPSYDLFMVLSAAYGLLYLASAVVMIPLMARRLHDIGCSGWFQLIQFFPWFGGLILLIMLILDSQRGPNKYGPATKYPR